MRAVITAATFGLLVGTGAVWAQTPDATGTSAPIMGVREFVTTAGSSNRFEIESSQLALNNTVSDEVKDFAQRMIDDHSRAGEAMKAALDDAGLTAPAAKPEFTNKHAQMLEQLKGAEGEAFGEAYVDMQVQAHNEAVTLFSDYAQSGEEQALVQFAEETLPTLKEHQQHINEIAGQ